NYGGSGYEITFGPWVTKGELNPMLTVVLEGRGIVSRSPSGLECDPTCSHAYAPGTQVIVTATPAKSWVFFRWIGGGCTDSHSTTCTVTLQANTSTTVTAEFFAIALTPPQEGLHVVVQGAGTVTSTPLGISCGDACSKAYIIVPQVTLTANPAAGTLFAGWSGACSGPNAT